MKEVKMKEVRMKEVIMRRKSVRTYTSEPLSKNHEKLLLNYIADEKNLIGIYGNYIQIHFTKTDGQKSEKIGTYGIIKNAPGYLITVCKNNKEAMMDCGYVLEKLVLFLGGMGVSTCWLGGTFRRQKLNLQSSIAKDEFIPIISPVGYEAHKQSFSDRAIRSLAKSHTRREFNDLFYYRDFRHPVMDSKLKEELEYIRVAPSASNKQPWRVVIDEKNVSHFYIERTPNYGKGKLAYDIQMVDMGIALSHYEQIKGSLNFRIDQPNIEMLSEYCEYVGSLG